MCTLFPSSPHLSLYLSLSRAVTPARIYRTISRAPNQVSKKLPNVLAQRVQAGVTSKEFHLLTAPF